MYTNTIRCLPVRLHVGYVGTYVHDGLFISQLKPNCWGGLFLLLA